MLFATLWRRSHVFSLSQPRSQCLSFFPSPQQEGEGKKRDPGNEAVIGQSQTGLHFPWTEFFNLLVLFSVAVSLFFFCLFSSFSFSFIAFFSLFACSFFCFSSFFLFFSSSFFCDFVFTGLDSDNWSGTSPFGEDSEHSCIEREIGLCWAPRKTLSSLQELVKLPIKQNSYKIMLTRVSSVQRTCPIRVYYEIHAPLL